MRGQMRSIIIELGRIVAHELRLLQADRSLWVVSALLALLSAYAIGTGLEHARGRDLARAEALAERAAAGEALAARLRRVMAREEPPDPWANPTDPALVGGGLATRYADLPSAPLALLAIGQSDMLPDLYSVSTASRVETMYDSEIENPWNLLTGRFDLAFVVTYLLPLFILGWSYNLLASEREQGTLRLLLSQPVRLGALVLGKVAVRAVVLCVWCVVLPVVASLALRPETRSAAGLAALAGWAALVVAYVLFWFALAALVDGVARSGALGALVLIASWVALVIVSPVALSLGASLASPAPSRAELATQTRVITAESLARLADAFGSDYRHVHDPERLLPRNGRFEVSDRLRAFFLASSELDARIERKLEAFDAQLLGQQVIVERWGLLSPAVLVHEGMAALAGNDTRRYQRFHGRVAAFHAEWRRFFEPRISQGFAVTEADLEALPSFHWVELEPSRLLRDVLRRLGGIVVAAGLAALVAARALRNYPVA